MLLSEIINKLQKKGIALNFSANGGRPASEIQISGFTDDSRQCGPETVFCLNHLAVPYLAQALEKKPAVVILPGRNPVPGMQLNGRPVITCENNARHANPDFILGMMAACFYGFPSESLDLTGVTGTNGKTTVNAMLFYLWKKAGIPCARIGTLGVEIFDGHRCRSFETGYTTPRSYQLHKLFAEMCAEGIQKVTLEVSSEAVSLGRHYGCHFARAGFTGLGSDHLDAHRNLQSYFAAKRKLFTTTLKQKGSVHIVQVKDQTIYKNIPASERLLACMIRFCREESKAADERIITINRPFSGYLPSPTDFNRYNAALALSLSGLSVSDSEAFHKFEGVDGRVQMVMPSREQYEIAGVVDYAHSPDSLEKLLTECRKMRPGLLICVFGCGGDRDPSKRPVMGKISSELSDISIVTDDNPRTEDPGKIRQEIIQAATGGHRVIEIASRKEAVEEAVRIAVESETRPVTVVVAGKGHENYQIYGKVKSHFSDQEELSAAFQKILV